LGLICWRFAEKRSKNEKVIALMMLFQYSEGRRIEFQGEGVIWMRGRDNQIENKFLSFF
jgi:hypothetical protein